MASSVIKAPMAKTTLYGGAITDKAISGTINFSDNAKNYDYLILRFKTNADYFEESLYEFDKANTWYYAVYDSSIGWLSSVFDFTVSADGNSATVRGASNNANWTVGVYAVIGVKIS